MTQTHTTREKAMESALRASLDLGTPWRESQSMAYAALSLPKDSVNAEMLEALRFVADAYQRYFDVMPVAWQTVDHIVQEAINRATGEG